MEAIQQRFSFPAACLVFAVIGVALGLTVARDGKLAGFVVGIAVIFAYYIFLYLAQSVTKGYYSGPDGGAKPLLLAQLSRWTPNIVLFPFGVLALIWRARWAEGRLPFRSLVKLTEAASGWLTRRQAAATATPRSGPGKARGRRVVVVIRVPNLSWLAPTILDRYISAIYLRAAGISFAALLGLFYISTFIDKSDRLFKGQTTGGTVLQLLGFMTPQFIYYVIPLAALLSVLVTFGLLSRSSELSVMKACGISLYRIAAPLLILSIAWSGILFGLEQRILARANEQVDRIDSQIRGRAPRTSNPLSRTWLIGHDGDIYHYLQSSPSKRWEAVSTVRRRPVAARTQLFTLAVFTGSEWSAPTAGSRTSSSRGHHPQPSNRPAAETQQPIADDDGPGAEALHRGSRPPAASSNASIDLRRSSPSRSSQWSALLISPSA